MNDQYYNHPASNQPAIGQGYHDPNYDMQANRYAMPKRILLYHLVIGIYLVISVRSIERIRISVIY